MSDAQLDRRIEALLQALLKLPPYAGVSYRGIDDATRFGMREGEAVVTTGLTATSRSVRIATENHTAAGLFVIMGRTGRAIDRFSTYAEEQEVVFLPSTLFRCVRRARLGALPVVIVEQLDLSKPAPERDPAAELEPWQEWLRVAARNHMDSLKQPAAPITSPGKFLGEIF